MACVYVGSICSKSTLFFAQLGKFVGTMKANVELFSISDWLIDSMVLLLDAAPTHTKIETRTNYNH